MHSAYRRSLWFSVFVCARFTQIDAGCRHREWPIQAVPHDSAVRAHLHYDVEFGVVSSGAAAAGGLSHQQDPPAIESIATFTESGCVGFHHDSPVVGSSVPGCSLMLAYDANTVATRRIRRVEAELYTVMERVARQQPQLPQGSRPPSQMLVSCTDCFPNVTDVADPQYNISAEGFRQAYGIKIQNWPPLTNQSSCERAFAYTDFRGFGGPQCVNDPELSCWDGIYANASKLRHMFSRSIYAQPAVASCVAVVSMGDEVTLPPPDDNKQQANAAFTAWARQRQLRPEDLGCPNGWVGCTYDTSSGTALTNAPRYYFSSLFKQDVREALRQDHTKFCALTALWSLLHSLFQLLFALFLLAGSVFHSSNEGLHRRGQALATTGWRWSKF